MIFYASIAVCKSTKIDVIPYSQISFLISVKLLMAPLEVYIDFQVFRRAYQSTLDSGTLSN
jgi:hypothetical protein